MSYRLAYLLLLLLLGGCGRPAATSSDNEFDANGPGDSLYATRIHISDDFLNGYSVLYVGERIIMRNHRDAECNFSVYLLAEDSLKKEGEFLLRGRGPNEMMYSDLSFDVASGELNMLTTMNRENRFCRVKLDPASNLYDLKTWEYKPLSLPDDQFFGNMAPIDRSSYLLQGGHRDSVNMFSLLDVESGRIVPLDFTFPTIPLKLTPLEQSIFWSGKLYKLPGKNRFVYLARDFKYAFIFDLDENNHVNIVRYICNELPAIHTSKANLPYAFDDPCETGFYTVATDDQHIYIGYQQLTYGEFRKVLNSGGRPEFYGNRINVYDWDGNFVRRLILDVAAGPMIVAGDQLIVKTTDPATAEDILVRYSL